MVPKRVGARIAGGALAVALVPAAAAAVDARPGSVARIASLQNQVETRPAGVAAWSPSVLSQPLGGKDRVRTGPASRAAILYSDQTLHRLNEKSEIEIEPPSAEAPGLLRVIAGTHYFSSRTPKDYGRIETPTVTAAIKGTEFVIEVAADNTTTITMLEGVVEASNPQGSITVGQGEAAYVEPGKAPVKRIVVRPRDAVSWSLYYPPVLGGADAERLAGAGERGRSLARAAEMLAAGQVAEAGPLIAAARAAKVDDPVALALASTVATAEGRKEEASRLADQGVAADPSSPAAALAASFAAQAAFDIPKARAMAEKAASLDATSSVALARAAELRMAEGDLDGAKRAAEEAVSRTPNEARALAVLGFAELTQYRSAEAEKVLERAVAADPALSLARLGLGIARIRRGRVAEGREELQTAVALDPEDSLTRAYLGKAYYEERRSKEAAKEFAAAKLADPLDPTPYLYDGIAKQNENRPVEALQDLQAAADRNDRRAVYRSRLLLDQDGAVRSADLARVYNDLGFEQLGIVTARQSADENQANFSSHLLLSGNYRFLPGYAGAYLSEVLQSRLYQPVGVNAVRPDVIAQTVSFNEYTALFDRPRGRAFGSVSYGSTATDLSKQLGPNDLCIDPATQTPVPCRDLIGITDSRLGAVNVVGSYNTDRFATALSIQHDYDSGFRENSDQNGTTYKGFFQFAPSWRDGIQLNLIHGDRRFGDLPLRQIPLYVVPERFDATTDNASVGWHRTISAASDLLVSAVYNRSKQTTSSSSGTLSGPQVEVQNVLRLRNMTWVFGAGGFDGTEKVTVKLPSPPSTIDLDLTDQYFNGYAYGKFRGMGPVEITAGAAVESVQAPIGALTPRDSNMLPGDVSYTKTVASPKLGVALYLKSGTTLRAAGFRRLAPAIGRFQSIEPTQVSGFNQIFEDPGGTRATSWGVGFDQALAHEGF
jgi:Flp pilus assembly protein TadD